MTPTQLQCQRFLAELLKDKTPIKNSVAKSVSDSFSHLTSGYETDPVQILKDGCIPAKSKEIIHIKGIKFFSLCEHHLLPFHGTASIFYIPSKNIAGLGKFPKALEALSLRLQLQETLTEQMASAIEKALAPKACAVMLEGFHFCLSMRGAKERDAQMQTLALRGEWKSEPKTFEALAKLLK